MTLPGFTDLGLAAVVLVLAIVPAALAVLAIIGVLQATRLDTRLESRLGPGGLRIAGTLGALALAALFLRLSWDWSAATHLKPLCAALATPWFSGLAPTGAQARSRPPAIGIVISRAGRSSSSGSDRTNATRVPSGEIAGSPARKTNQ